MTYADLIAWISNPINDLIVLSYLAAEFQVLSTDTGWRWAQVIADLLNALPTARFAGALKAFKRKAP